MYGILDSTWAGYGGFAYAGEAPMSVQNEEALGLYDQFGWQPWRDHCTGY